MSVPEIGYRALRKGRMSFSGADYFITKTTLQRLPADEPYEQGTLMGEGIAEIIMNSLNWLHTKNYISLLAYVIMPDHVHILFTLGEERTLEQVMQQFGSFTGLQIARKLGREGSIWQKGYHDRLMRDYKELQVMNNYIINNPVEAGYVQEASEWPWLFSVDDNEVM